MCDDKPLTTETLISGMRLTEFRCRLSRWSRAIHTYTPGTSHEAFVQILSSFSILSNARSSVQDEYETPQATCQKASHTHPFTQTRTALGGSSVDAVVACELNNTTPTPSQANAIMTSKKPRLAMGDCRNPYRIFLHMILSQVQQQSYI